MAQKANPLGKGYVQIYTGNGKGKTTAALGLAFRAMGCGLKTYMGQFMKGTHYSELDAAKMVSDYVTMEQYGKKGFMHVKPEPDEEDIRMARDGLEKCRSAMLSGNYNVVILDEVMTARRFGLLSTEDILETLKAKPDGVELVMTGRDAPPEVIEAADLVTEMREVKHYYRNRVRAREGIEC